MTVPDYNLDVMEFSYEAAIAWLGGMNTLRQAFMWVETPQGFEFWLAQEQNPDHVGRSIVQFLVEAYPDLVALNLQRSLA